MKSLVLAINHRFAPGEPRGCRHRPSRAVHISHHRSSAVLKECTYSVWGVLRTNSRTVEEEADGSLLLALTLTEGVHQLLQLGRALDLEEDLIVVVGDLDVEVLRGSRAFLFGRHVGC